MSSWLAAQFLKYYNTLEILIAYLALPGVALVGQLPVNRAVRTGAIRSIDIGKTGKSGPRYRAIDDISSGSILSILSRLSISTAVESQRLDPLTARREFGTLLNN